jgi:hypothetical protein
MELRRTARLGVLEKLEVDRTFYNKFRVARGHDQVSFGNGPTLQKSGLPNRSIR